MAEHRNIVDRMIGLEEKREFHEFENRAQKLGENYYEDYKDAFGEAAAAGIKKDAAYQRAAASDITPLREFMG